MGEIIFRFDREAYYQLKYLIGEAIDNGEDTIQFQEHDLNIEDAKFILDQLKENEIKEKGNTITLEEFEEFRKNDERIYASSTLSNKSIKINGTGQIVVYHNEILILQTTFPEVAVAVYNSLD